MIEQLGDGQPGRRRLTRDLQDLADAVHDRDRRGIAVLDDAQQDRATPVLANDVLLNRPAVVHLPDILEKHCLPIDIFDRNVVEVGDGRRHRIGAHRVLRVADLGETRRQCQALGVDRVHHVRRSQARGLELDRVDIDHDLPELAPIRSRHGHAVHRGKLLAQVVQSVIVELLFIEAVGAQGELQHRNARGIELHHDRWVYAGGQQGADRICCRDDLGDGQIDANVRLEIDLLDIEAVEGLRLDVLDTVDVRADRVLAIGADPLLHLGRGQAGVLPDDRHHRNVDLREDVLRHDHDGRDAQEHN